MNIKRAVTHEFNRVPEVHINRSSFNRSHEYKTTFDSGWLVPFYVDEVLPGDTFSARTTLFCRLNTPVVPIMDNLYLETFYFFVPNRLLWDNFKKFMGEKVNPGDSTVYALPTITCPAGGWAVGSLSDYFGLPTGIAGITGVTSLWHRAYNLIWNEWFRDENLQDSVSVPKTDGADADATFTLLKRGKRHDYFTSCLPWPQKGTAVSMPLGTSAPVMGIGTYDANSAAAVTYYDSKGNTIAPGVYGWPQTGGLFFVDHTNSSGSASATHYPAVYADLSSATASTVNSLRLAVQMQELYELDARCGTRYIEIIRGHFGVVSPDQRQQRPEYLGGSSTCFVVNSVAQTSSTDATSPQGNLSAFGLASDRHHGFTKSFDEHGVIIGLVNVRANLTYQQGLDRMFSRSTRWDFYWPSLAHLGEQSVLNKELYCQGTADDQLTFGYQERYAEYRYKASKITGKMRSTYATPLDVWHLAQKFESLPTLADTFIKETPPISRVVAVNTEPEFFLDAFIDLRCARPMPVYATPGLCRRI